MSDICPECSAPIANAATCVASCAGAKARIESLERDLLQVNGFADSWMSRYTEEVAKNKIATAQVESLAASLDAMRTHPNGLWMVHYEEAGKPPEIFFGEGAENAARQRYAVANHNWSCHLLSRVPDARKART